MPLFVLMGLLVTVSGVGKDTFDVFERLLRRVTAGLGIATVFANAVFASITGISIASASVFAAGRGARDDPPRLYPRNSPPASSPARRCSGMLIPPSLLMIVYAVLAEESVGRMFLAGVGPGILLSFAFSVTILLLARFRARDGLRPDRRTSSRYDDLRAPRHACARRCRSSRWSLLVLGGLYGGFLNPTEAGAVGALGALVIALLRRSLTGRSFWNLLVETGQITVSVLFLIMAATFFSRMLAMSGLPARAGRVVPRRADRSLRLPRSSISLLVIVLGCLIDSISIMLILLPIALPVAAGGGFRPDLVRRADRGRGRDRAADAALRPLGLHHQVGDRRRRPSRSARSSAARCPSSSR